MEMDNLKKELKHSLPDIEKTIVKNGIIELPDGLILTKAENIEELVKKVEELHGDVMTIRQAVMNFCTTLNLTDETGQNLHPQIRNKEKSPVKFMIKGGMEIFRLIMSADSDVEAQKELDSKFSFLDEAGPTLEKYGSGN